MKRMIQVAIEKNKFFYFFLQSLLQAQMQFFFADLQLTVDIV